MGPRQMGLVPYRRDTTEHAHTVPSARTQKRTDCKMRRDATLGLQDHKELASVIEACCSDLLLILCGVFSAQRYCPTKQAFNLVSESHYKLADSQKQLT